MSIKSHTGMTVVLTRGISTLSVKAIKIVVNTPFAMTRLTYYWFDASERGNEDHHTTLVLMWRVCTYQVTL